jgi:YjbE family integral membrane protein
MDWLGASELTALGQVILIDLVLAGDNAIVVGMAAAGLPANQRVKVIAIGIIAATVLRILFSLGISYLLQIPGLLLIGGVLLVYVCWKMWTEIRDDRTRRLAGVDVDEHGHAHVHGAAPKTFAAAAWQIVIADVSMSLDNVLAVAGAAGHHTWVLVVGLALSVVLMGVAATAIANLLKRYPWIAYIGLAVIVYVAIDMCIRGAIAVWPYITPYLASGA